MVASRVRKPRDKASVENAVKLAYQRIYAPLRDQIFKSKKITVPCAGTINQTQYTAFFKAKNIQDLKCLNLKKGIVARITWRTLCLSANYFWQSTTEIIMLYWDRTSINISVPMPRSARD
ncbi:MAG: hypothetical protein IPN15_10220 [Saprospiraceae bacterium]|nr:hypothetical protein [Candidatus Vicinibacter affinis]